MGTGGAALDPGGAGGPSGSGGATGSDGNACYPNGTCNAGLSCLSNLCAKAIGTGGTTSTGHDEHRPWARLSEASPSLTEHLVRGVLGFTAKD
jgi:hypothetical protein